MARSGDRRRSRLLTIVALLAAAPSLCCCRGGCCRRQPNCTAHLLQPSKLPPQHSGSLPQQPPPAFKPGFLHQLGEWWGQGFGDFNAKMKNAKDQLDDLKNDQSTKDATAATQDALKNAAQTMVRLPSTRMFELHDKCQPAANGAPDCPTAANNACRVKGFTGGKPMGISTSQVCSSQALLSGGSPGRRLPRRDLHPRHRLPVGRAPAAPCFASQMC